VTTRAETDIRQKTARNAERCLPGPTGNQEVKRQNRRLEVVLERFAVPAHLFPEFDLNDLSTRWAYDVMEEEYGIAVVRARQSLEPVVATEYEA
jgi:DNA-binding GntR family transcriptional regulator